MAARTRISSKQHDSGTELGRIDRIELENFKSYEGHHVIGPFDKFTCIIGPNGSGKSNVMDAISFCLGIKARHLRGDRLKDLVYRREEERAESNTRTAKVTMVFQTTRGDQLHFGRLINANGQGTYRYGPPDMMRSTSYDDFIEALAREQVLVQARNFLVFQGDVMELARRQGQDLTGMLETISGSIQLKESYENLSKELEVIQEKARMHFQHRREVETTVDILLKQRAEVERYHRLRAEREQLAVETVLFKLFCAECERDRNQQVGASLKNDLARSEGDVRAIRREAEETELQRKKVTTECEDAQSKHFVLNSNLEQSNLDQLSSGKEVAHYSKRLAEKEANIREEELKQRRLETATTQGAEEKLRLEQQIAKLKSKQVGSAVQLSDAQRALYDQAVVKTDSMNSRTRERLRETEEQLENGLRALAALRQELMDLDENRTDSETKLEELARSRVQVEAELDRLGAQRVERKNQEAGVDHEIKNFTLFKDSLVDEQRSLRVNLDSAKARREKLELVDARGRVADELRGAFPDGVIGRISEMVLPTQKRFDLPLQMSLGSMAEAFVVVDSKAGRQCIQYLKERRMSSETFLPLDRCVVPNVGALHLLTQGYPARRLAVHCVQHNVKFFERNPRWQADGPNHVDTTTNFLLNGTIVVDTIEEAKETAYRDARKRGLMPRVVTLDGEVISPNGNMSVQSMSSFERVEFGGAEQLQQIKEQEEKLASVDKDLTTLVEELAKKKKISVQVREQAKELEERHHACEVQARDVEKRQKDEQRTVDASMGRIKELKANIEQTMKRSNELEKAKDGLEAELVKVGKKHFEALNRELGVDDIRDIMLKEQREKRHHRQEVEKLEDQLQTLANKERSAEQRAREGSRLEALQRDCAQYRREIEGAQERHKAKEERGRMFEERVAASATRVREVGEAKEKLENEVKDKRVQLQSLKAQMDESKQNLKKYTEKVRTLVLIQCGIFRDCFEKLIEIPATSRSEAAMEPILHGERDLEDMTFEELEAAAKSTKVDFSVLPDEKKALAERTRLVDARGVEGEYETRIAEINKEMEGLSPNMRAVEEHDAEEGRLRDIRQRADEASTESKRLAREFEVVKADRIARFMTCFKHVEATVQTCYRELTAYDGFDGGSAYLDLDDAEEPYNGGITFTACPPGKRFFPMDLLSGGEKSMASMALLFAMHSFHPPPFMILDEVDAPFDRKNTNSLVAYLRKLKFQCLVISLKDTFFSHSDLIVGIYKDKELQSSGSLSLPLQKLGVESESMETGIPKVESRFDVD